MKELLYMNHRQNKISSNKLVIGLRSTIDTYGSSHNDMWAFTTTNLTSCKEDWIYENNNNWYISSLVADYEVLHGPPRPTAECLGPIGGWLWGAARPTSTNCRVPRSEHLSDGADPLYVSMNWHSYLELLNCIHSRNKILLNIIWNL